MDKRVAIVGYSYRLPQTNKDSFWQDLVDEKDLVTEVDPSRWAFDNLLHPDKQHPGTSYTYQAGSLGDISQFDAAFFGISPREAAMMDPQQCYLLEMVWEAFEDAGIKPSRFRKSHCGVYIGISSVDYSYRVGDDLSTLNASSATGNTNSIAANRISYTFDLTGPSLAVDTACSSSMVAFHQACQAILSGDIDTALTGGISLHLHPFGFLVFSKASMLSPDGRCKVFDAAANGYVRSEGGGIFILKDYDKALRDGDQIHAVIAASAVNTDGHKSGMTIPSCKAQTALMEKAYAQAGISPAEVDYLEAHGTGTPVGDPIETRSIGQALGQKRTTALPIGSVKSNLGHLEPASGVAGLVKALLVIKHRAVPATISMKTPNPDILFDEWNIQVVDKLMPLKQEGTLTVGINSFGFGGANAHVILQSAPQDATRITPESTQPLPVIISAGSTDAVQAYAGKLAEHLRKHPDTPLYDLAWNYAICRERLPYAARFQATDITSLQDQLNQFIHQEEPSLAETGLLQCQGPVFVYSGNGCQWEAMGRTLLENSDFHAFISEIDTLFAEYGDFSILDELTGDNGTGRLEYTEIAQPTLFALQVGITRYLQQQGVHPVAVTGHSVGEVAAAWAAGALTLADAVKVIYYRSLYQGKTKGQGAMTAVGLGQDAINEHLQQGSYTQVYLAGINSHKGITLAGNAEQLEQLEQQLKEDKVFVLRLGLDYAFHSPMMDSVQTGLTQALVDIQPKSVHTPFISTVTGQTLTGEQLDADYWWHNIREPVLFKQALNLLLEQGHNCFIEVGSHPVLKNYIQDQTREMGTQARIIPCISRNQGQWQELEDTVTAALLAGACNMDIWFPVAGQRLELPTYAWQGEHHWYDSTAESYQLLERRNIHPLLGAPLPLQPLCWENQLDTGKYPWLADHQVGESVLFPGAGFIELALTAAREFQEQPICEIEELEILAPLLLENLPSKVIQTRMDSGTGDINIYARTHTQSHEWTLHCKARAVHQSSALQLQQARFQLPERTPDYNGNEHQQLTRHAGLHYGPAFSAITSVWCDNQTVLAQLHLPESISNQIDHYQLHPGLLDSAIQLIVHLLHDRLANSPGMAFIPVRAGRVTLNRQCSGPVVYAHLSLQKRSSHSLLTRLTLFNEQMAPLAELDELRFKAARLYKTQEHRLAWLNYYLTPIDTGSGQDTSALQTSLQNAFIDHQQTLARYSQEIAPLLEALTSQTAQEVLTCAPTLQTAQADSPLLQSFQNYVQAAGICTDNPGSEISSMLIWNTLLREYPEYFATLHLAGRSSLHLARQLQNHTPESDDLASSYQRFFSNLYEHTLQQVITAPLQQALGQLQVNLPSGTRLRVLEAASRQPRYTHTVCQSLDFSTADYCFASTGQDALEHFKLLQEGYPLATSITLDADSSTTHAPCQLIILTLDSHLSTENLQLLESLQPLLQPGTQLLLSALEPLPWLDLALGNHPQWWHNGVSPQTSSQQWLATLNEQGYQHTRVLGTTPQGGYLLSASWPDTAKPTAQQPATDSEYWLLAGNQGTASEAICQLLEQVGIHYRHTPALSVQDLTDKVSRLLLLPESSQLPPTSQQAERCDTIAQSLKLLESQPSSPALLILTQGVGPALLCDQTFPDQPTDIPADAALWGFARTLMNEALNLDVQLLDLPDELTPEALTALQQTLLVPNSEQELILTSAGTRFAPRLREIQPNTNTPQNAAETEQIRLGFDLPGQLRHLRWQAHTLPTLADDELEIEVKATGLNFRDVMYALGLLSDEAIENGFAGATMGLEFAGKVVRTGANVRDYQPGDRVVGFGSACFSNRMLAKSFAVSPLPEGMQYEMAATVPTTFLTVYYALHHLARLQPGERVLIHGAAGGVGIAAIQIAQWLGAEIYATVGSQEKRDFVRLLGVKHIYNSRELTYAEEILGSTPDGKGVDVVLNSLAGEAINQNFRVLKPFGRFLELGKRDFYENTPIGLRPFRNNISYFGIDADQLQKEQPELTARLFAELMALFHEGTLFALPYTRFDAHQIVDAFRYMQQARQIGKIVVTYPANMQASTPPACCHAADTLQLDPQATYLVTGGLGGFGLKSAQWLIDKGARHLLLLSRRGANSEEASSFLQQSAAAGIHVQAIACDITDAGALEQIIAACGKEYPPLKGIIHAAAVIQDGLIRNLDKEQIATNLSAKMQGALHLHELTARLPLDFFVLYSSATTLLGNPGQAAYVAANHWLEALAGTRIRHGLPATCIRWGAIDDVGFLARNSDIKQALQKRLGGDALSSDIALDQLEIALLSNTPLAGIMELDWGALSRFLPTAAHAKFREMASQGRDADTRDDDSVDLETMLSTLSPTELQQALLDILTQELGEILMIPSHKIDPDKSIYDMGMDSLMGVELITALEGRLGIQVPVMALTETPKLTQLSEKLIELAQNGADASNPQADEAALMSAQHGTSLHTDVPETGSP